MSGLNPWTADDIKALAVAQLEANNTVQYLRDFDGCEFRVDGYNQQSGVIFGRRKNCDGEWNDLQSERSPVIGVDGNGFQLTDAGRAWLEQNRSHEPVGEVVNVPEPEASSESQPHSLPKVVATCDMKTAAAFVDAMRNSTRNQIAIGLANANAALAFTLAPNEWAERIMVAADALAIRLVKPSPFIATTCPE